jgi:hypothetical protein
MLVAAALCPAPPLLARELTGTDPVIPELRRACLEAAGGLLDIQPDLIVVTGAGPQTREWDPAGRLDLTVFAPALARSQPAPGPGLPAALGLGAMLLDQAGYAGPRILQSVAADAPAARCAALGEWLAGLRSRVALLVMADGTARRTLKAPGYLDERAAPFDDDVTRMLTGSDLAPLLRLDAGLASDLMATGRPGWQVLAGAAGGLRAACKVRYRNDPFGVYYLAASITLQIEETVLRRD